MTDSEKLDLIISRLEKLDSLEKDMHSLKRQVMKSTAELKAMDEMILDEVERVHGILDRHKADQTVHTA